MKLNEKAECINADSFIELKAEVLTELLCMLVIWHDVQAQSTIESYA